MKDRSTDSILRLRDVMRRTGLSRATIYRLEGAGRFPAKLRMSVNCVGWYESDIGDYVANPTDYRQPQQED